MIVLDFQLRLHHGSRGAIQGELSVVATGQRLPVRSLVHLLQLLREEMDTVRPVETTGLERLLAMHRERIRAAECDQKAIANYPEPIFVGHGTREVHVR